jgi:uncharacterized protein YndB with AHSA1/START domain
MTNIANFEVDEFMPHPPARVWRALTEPALMSTWLMPTEGFAPVVGTRFRFRTDPVPQTNFSGLVECRVLDVVPRRLLRISWSSVGTALDSTVTWQLVPEGTGTRMLLTHAGFDLDDPEQARAFKIMNGGWRSHVLVRMLAALDHLATVTDETDA